MAILGRRDQHLVYFNLSLDLSNADKYWNQNSIHLQSAYYGMEYPAITLLFHTKRFLWHIHIKLQASWWRPQWVLIERSCHLTQVADIEKKLKIKKNND